MRSTAIIDIIHSGECFAFRETNRTPVAGTCSRCGYISSQALCKACVLLEGLNKGLARVAVGRETRMARALEQRAPKPPPTTVLPSALPP